jgi:hypothetical protein
VLYGTGREFSDLNVARLLQWGGSAVVHGVLVFWLVYAAFDAADTTWDLSSRGDGLDVRGLTTFFVMTWTMQLTFALEVLTWTRVHAAVLAISQVGFLLFAVVYNVLLSASPNFYGVTFETLARPAFWLLIALVMGAVLAYELGARALRTSIWPRPEETARLWAALPAAAPSGGWGDELTQEERARVEAARGLLQQKDGEPPKNGAPLGASGPPPAASGAAAAAAEPPPAAGPKWEPAGAAASGGGSRPFGSGGAAGASSWRGDKSAAGGSRWPSAVGAAEEAGGHSAAGAAAGASPTAASAWGARGVQF